MPDQVRDQTSRSYLEAIRRRVCSVCLDSGDDGSCSLTGRICAIEAHLPGLVKVILATKSGRMDEYYDAIRTQVCSGCQHQGEAGRCALRDSGDCALETYLPLVLDAIEGVDRSTCAEAPGCCA